jgi:protein tyrosine phosphatase (PTP) superfamily phosphohydrolase (DUF442 family)
MDDPTQIFNYRRLTALITTSGQPSEAQITAIAQSGVVKIINLALHTHERALDDEAGFVHAQGMEYIHIPVDFDNPTEANYKQFCDEMDRCNTQVIHVHCILNARVSAFFYRYQKERLGVAEKQARAMMETVWRPGGVWAAFIGDEALLDYPHRYAGEDYAAELADSRFAR